MSSIPKTLPVKFVTKKQSILSQLALDPSDYDDKSPKGSVDIQILDLIRLINGVDGWVTTSSCAGRVAVFVEGPKKEIPANVLNVPKLQSEPTSRGSPEEQQTDGMTKTSVKTAPGGKGGGHWLYVSHDPLELTSRPETRFLTADFGLSSNSVPTKTHGSQSRLVHMTYSPLILHILCASLQYAKPLLSAAINAGFRESGVQSLKALETDFNGDGVMVAIRTNGIVFESVVGVYDSELEIAQSLVTDAYLEICASVVNERFQWNEIRKQRLTRELQSVIERQAWEPEKRVETKEERREWKRKEGLALQAERASQPEAIEPPDEELDDMNIIDTTSQDT